MSEPTEYRGSLTREQFLFFETRSIAKLILEGLTEEDAVSRAIDDNLLQFPTEKNVSSIAKGCYRRLAACDNKNLVEIIANSPVDIAKQANLYALMTYNKIVWDFMLEVIGEKYRTQDFSYSNSDAIVFLDNLREREIDIEWTDATCNKIRQVLNNSLAEVGYLDDVKSTTLNPLYLYDELKDVIIENGDNIVLPAFNCFY